MKARAVLLLALMVGACATTPPAPPSQLLNDHLFAAPSERISADDVFALSDDMKRYLAEEIDGRPLGRGGRQGLVDALYHRGQLKLEYDSVMTRNAAQAFADRAGNCLSLVIMTAAFAKAMDLPVRFQSVASDDTVARSGDIHFFVSHVNLALGSKPVEWGFQRGRSDEITVDFLPAQQAGAQRTRPVREEMIVAMYMNNRAAEALVGGRLDDAYAWARAAIIEEPSFLSAHNTLGVVYQRHGDLAQAEAAYAYILEREPGNTRVMANQVRLLGARGRVADAASLAAKLAQLEPNPPFSLFERGRAAMRAGDFRTARDAFASEVERAPYYHEFRYWLASAHAALGETERARKELATALEYSSSRSEHDLYAAKLDRIRASALH